MMAGPQLAGYAQEMFDKLQRPIVIVETGCLRRPEEQSHQDDGWSTLYFAKWVQNHPGSKFFSVDMNMLHINIAASILSENGITPDRPMFTCGESVDFLTSFGGTIDLAYLDSCDGWDHGLAEFVAAESKGAQMIVMDDYISKVVSAEKYAQGHGWNVQQEVRFTVMRK